MLKNFGSLMEMRKGDWHHQFWGKDQKRTQQAKLEKNKIGNSDYRKSWTLKQMQLFSNVKQKYEYYQFMKWLYCIKK